MNPKNWGALRPIPWVGGVVDLQKYTPFYMNRKDTEFVRFRSNGTSAITEDPPGKYDPSCFKVIQSHRNPQGLID